MIEVLCFVLSFLALWAPSFILHELMHFAESKRQGGDGYINIWYYNGIPSMRFILTKPIYNRGLLNLSGGLYSGIILCILTVITWNITWLSSSLFLLASINLTYSIYEWQFLDRISLRQYMKWHWFVYLIGFCIGLWLLLSR